MNKYIELRDSCTCIPLLVVPIEEMPLTRSVGFVSGQFFLVTKLVNMQTHYSPDHWPDEWHRSVHRAIIDNWPTLKSGDVLDMRVVRGETTEPVQSQFADSAEFYNPKLESLMISFEIVDHNGELWSAAIRGETVHPYVKLRQILKAGFKRCTVYLADIIIILPFGNMEGNDDVTVRAFDCMQGDFREGTWSFAQASAILKLALLGDEIEDAKEMYEIAEAGIVGWPNSIRPIP